MSARAAFDRARETLAQLGLPALLPRLHAAGLGISHSVLGGSHSVAIYPPIDSLLPVDPNALLGAVDTGDETSLYLHIPFCETRCTFCHYAVRPYSGEGRSSDLEQDHVTRYLAALERELAWWGDRLAVRGTRVTSIYIGGGTPLILGAAALGRLLAAIEAAFDIVPGTEICVEGSPLTITAPDGADMLSALRQRGVTRLSFGVQSFDDVVLRYAARGYRRDVAIRAATIADAIFDNWNLDLIQGLYRGSPEETWGNLQVVAELRPAHLTWYHGRFADRPQGSWYQGEARAAGFENEQATLLGRTLIWQEMAALGYHRSDGNRFVREHRHADPFKPIRTSATRNLLGIGASSYSHLASRPGHDGFGQVFRNQPDLQRYIDGVMAGESPIATARAIDDEERLATSYATGLRNGRVDDPALAAIRARQPALAAAYEAQARSLADLGVVEAWLDDGGATGLRLSELGRLFEDEALALFFSPSVKRVLADKQRAPAAAYA